VVIPSYNRQAYISETLNSVLRQTLPDFEVVVVDDGSSDGTVDIVEEFCRRDPRVRCVRQQNAGCGTARNHGLAASSPESEYVIFLDSDDLWTPEALETLVKAADAHPDRSIFYTPWEYIRCIDGEGRPVPSVIPPGITAPALFSRVFHRCVTADACDTNPLPYMSAMCLFLSPGVVLLRKSILHPDPFDTSLANHEDWDLWIRLSREYRLTTVPGHIFFYRKHAGAKSNNWKRVARNRERIYRNLENQPGISKEERAIYRRSAWTHYICQAVMCRALLTDAASRRDYRTAQLYAIRVIRRYGNAAATWMRSLIKMS
jgi:glycosyltransferase involved in cell wall biosynthesis